MKFISPQIGIFFICAHLICTQAFAESHIDSDLMAKMASSELKASLLLEKQPDAEIINLIVNEDFQKFETLSKKYEEEFKTNSKYESPLMKLYSALDSDNPLLNDKLNKWVDLRPSYISYCARGTYLELRGAAARGREYISRTPVANIERMQEFHQQASADLLEAIKRNKNFAPAYRSLINIEKLSGSSINAKKIVHEAERWIPQTYYIRGEYLRSLHPRWGELL